VTVADLVQELGGAAPLVSDLVRELGGPDTLDWPDSFPPYLSPSSISHAQCPERWRRKYVLRQSEPSNTNLIVGQGVHGAAELNYREKVTTHEDLPVDEFLDAAAEAFNTKAEEDGERYGIEWGSWKPGDAKDESVRLARAYRMIAAPTFQPTAVELEPTPGWVPGVPVPMQGRVDIHNDEFTLDIKTAAQKPANGKPSGDWRLKAMVYQTMIERPFGWHVVTKAKEAGVYTPVTDPGLLVQPVRQLAERRIRSLAENLVSLYGRYGPDDPWPTTAPEHTWLCGLCGHRPTCAWWTG
jgi:hypothetical protein